MAAKGRAGIRPFEILARSPQLNVCDYWLRREVNKRTRARGRAFPSDKRETRAAFMRRLKARGHGRPLGHDQPEHRGHEEALPALG